MKMQDGSAVFMVRDKRMKSMIDFLYPIGSVYISADNSKTKADFPFMQYGTWEELPANLCLQTGNASEAGTQRSAGLPNITGKIVFSRVRNNDSYAEGALVKLFKAHADNIAYPYDWKEQPGDEGGYYFLY